MSLITASNLSKSFGAEDIFRSVDLSISKGSRLALVGPNGCGKTTLLRILFGLEEPSGGTVARARKSSIGYLPQEADFEMEGSLWEACEAVFVYFKVEQAELARLEALMSDPDRADDAMQKYGPLQRSFEQRGGYLYPLRIKQVLTGLGFSPADLHMPVTHLSGGQRTRAYLARLLLSNPDLLLLDEPTNHLDIAAVEWLEGYLGQWDGAALIVSHDRYFLDRVANGILEMSFGSLETYHGNYSAYLEQRQARWQRRQETFEREKEKLLKDVDYIKRNISGQNVAQAKGKLRRLSRIVQAIEQVGMETVLSKGWLELSDEVTIAVSPFGVEEAERRVRSLHLPDPRPPRLNLHLRTEQRSGNLVIRTKKLIIGYPGKILFAAPDIELRWRECAALIGPNGAGKTTFLKTILEQLEPMSGEVIPGAALKIGYFAQAHEGLDPEHAAVEEIMLAAPQMLPGEARSYLGKYLFSGDDVFKKVGVLSGGERGRLALAKLALEDTNLLLLDEPTNHLDIPSQEILQSVLDDYGGTILLVSHDRYLIDALATQVWEIDPAESSLAVFRGTYSQMKEEQERKQIQEALDVQERERASHPDRTARNLSTKEERRKVARLQELENRIVALETELATIAVRLENPPDDPARVAQLGREYTRLQGEMDALLMDWERLNP